MHWKRVPCKGWVPQAEQAGAGAGASVSAYFLSPPVSLLSTLLEVGLVEDALLEAPVPESGRGANGGGEKFRLSHTTKGGANSRDASSRTGKASCGGEPVPGWQTSFVPAFTPFEAGTCVVDGDEGQDDTAGLASGMVTGGLGCSPIEATLLIVLRVPEVVVVVVWVG